MKKLAIIALVALVAESFADDKPIVTGPRLVTVRELIAKLQTRPLDDLVYAGGDASIGVYNRLNFKDPNGPVWIPLSDPHATVNYPPKILWQGWLITHDETDRNNVASLVELYDAQIGLRDDGVVVWKKQKKGEK